MRRHISMVCFWASGLKIEPGISSAVVDVGARLPARRAVHVDDYVNVVFARPQHEAVEQAEALVIVRVEEFPMDGDA